MSDDARLGEQRVPADVVHVVMGVEDDLGRCAAVRELVDQPLRHLREHHRVDHEGGAVLEHQPGVRHPRLALTLQHRDHAVSHLHHLLVGPCGHRVGTVAVS